MRPARASVLGMLVAAGLAGVVLGAFRAHASLGWFLLGTIGVAAARARAAGRAAALRGSEGGPPLLRSLAPAAVHLGLVLVPCLGLFFALERDQFVDHERRVGYVYRGGWGRGCGMRRDSIPVGGVLQCALLGGAISPPIRRALRRIGPRG